MKLRHVVIEMNECILLANIIKTGIFPTMKAYVILEIVPCFNRNELIILAI